MRVDVKPEVLDDLKKALENRNRRVVRIDLGGFG
jgi:hypothetical protein